MKILRASSHDYHHLIQRWQQLPMPPGGRLEIFAEADGLPVWRLRLGEAASGGEAIYLSAGIHGDECAPVWALLHWAEQEWPAICRGQFLIFPCLNPAGLLENRRTDQAGRDLNRSFQDESIPLIRAWRKEVEGRRFSRTLCLHEDFDARGIYLYELCPPDLAGTGRAILESCGELIPPDDRAFIEGAPFERGLAQHRPEEIQAVVESRLAGGYPEAIQLFLHHGDINLTFETPSELDIDLRIATHMRAIRSLLGR